MNGHRLMLGLLLLGLFSTAQAARVSDIRSTKHNLSVTGPGTVKAVSETQVCVFCHTPHGSTASVGAPLWNRELSGATYTPYTSNSINATDIAAEPGGSSKLCLSCHDGTLAIGSVNVSSGQTGVSIDMSGTGAAGTMATGQGESSGFTRRLGVDLTNDHPISFTYNSTLALADGELRDPGSAPHIGTRAPGIRHQVPLEDGKVECVSCHDPHIRDSDPSKNIKFLRLNRFQSSTPGGGSFNESGDIVCLACHDKLGQAWADSAHANPSVADETYKSASAALREFPDGTRVWEAACLNCHDTHTVQGSRRLLREGTDAAGGPTTPRLGGSAAIESTCYQCHSNAAESILSTVTDVPDIKTDFQLPRRMPISSNDQPAGAEQHNINDADFIETQDNLGRNQTTNNRHAECTDCHNPHRLMKNRLFNGSGSSADSTHDPDSPSNIASGALRGTWGVEPVYSSTSFQDKPSGYTVKKGDGGSGASTAVTSAHLTREYQICLKCHSDYGYQDDNVYPVGTRPDLGDSGGGTPAGTNGMTQYTNQAKEFQAPFSHQGEGSAANTGAGSGYATNNHRSWHPVMDSTGRTATVRAMNANAFLLPWRNNIGNQTMYCTDCHGSATANATRVPTGSNPWGPHGSSKNFILKGDWDSNTGSGQSDDLCFKCHDYNTYPADGGSRTGFYSSDRGDLHSYHRKKIGAMKCSWCHVAVPHGWKNKALLVNLNDVGPEAGKAAGGEEICTGSGGWGSTNGGCSKDNGYTNAPYYLNAFLKVINFRPSGQWRENDCGSKSGNTGRDWMRDEACESPN
ncbi:multiheme c-type cytochrome [Sedimenticola hydrogenitrophicus]|uniref:multiheme c-type cytochrome n=1 Tax=Sedimenticola hydrogenitrophicus TaxID=2967975 RepID=UPI0023B010F3